MSRLWPALALLAACYPADGAAPPLTAPADARALVAIDVHRLAAGGIGVAGAVGVDLTQGGRGQEDAAFVYQPPPELDQPLVVAAFYREDLAALGLVAGTLTIGGCPLAAPFATLAWAPGDDAWAPYADDAPLRLLKVVRSTGCAGE